MLQYIDTAYWSDADCEGPFDGDVHCNTNNRCEGMPGEVVGELSFHPFARGSDPTFYGDYDDWAMMRWGFCEHSQWAEASTVAMGGLVPTGTGPHRPLAYTGDARCGPPPLFVEPTPPGVGFVLSAPDDSERTTNPGLYAPSEYLCDL